MLDFNDVLLLGVLSAVFSALFCVILGFVLQMLRDRDVEDLYNKIDSLDMTVRGSVGNAKRSEKAERLQGVMIEFATAMKEPNANVTEILKRLAMQNPDLAMDLVKKGIKL